MTPNIFPKLERNCDKNSNQTDSDSSKMKQFEVCRIYFSYQMPLVG